MTESYPFLNDTDHKRAFRVFFYGRVYIYMICVCGNIFWCYIKTTSLNTPLMGPLYMEALQVDISTSREAPLIELVYTFSQLYLNESSQETDLEEHNLSTLLPPLP